MDNIELTKEFFRVIEANDWDRLYEITSDDFLFWAPTLPSFDKEQYIECQKAIQKAFPDWSYNLSEVIEEGYCVLAKVRITGTHTEDLVLSFLGLNPMKATNMRIEFPFENAVFTFEGGKILEIAVESDNPEALAEVFHQLGLL